MCILFEIVVVVDPISLGSHATDRPGCVCRRWLLGSQQFRLSDIRRQTSLIGARDRSVVSGDRSNDVTTRDQRSVSVACASDRPHSIHYTLTVPANCNRGSC